MTITSVGTPLRTAYNSTRTVTTGNVAASGVLQADDWVVTGVRGSLAAGTMVTPGDWVNALNDNNVGVGPDHANLLLLHKVTPAEVLADTRAWTLTNLWDAQQTGAAYSMVRRGVDPNNPIDAFNVASGASTATHVLASLNAGDITFTGDQVVSFVSGPTTQTYATDPADWTSQVKNAGGQNTGNLLTRNTLTTAAVAVAATNITASSAVSYQSITAALKDAAASAGDTTKFFFIQ